MFAHRNRIQFLYLEGYEMLQKRCLFTTFVMNVFGIAQKAIKNNRVRKQKTKRYNYKTEILGCFINQQLLTKTKQRMKNKAYHFF